MTMKETKFKYTEVGRIPEDWDIILLGDIFEFKNGLNASKDCFGFGSPIINYTDVYRQEPLGHSNIKGKVSLSKSDIKRFQVHKNDVFFTRTSETPEEVGYSSVLLEDIEDCVFSGFVLRARPKKQVLAPKYCIYCFSTKQVRNAIINSCTYTTRALTNGKVLSAIHISLPPIEEQRRIASALTSIDNLIDSLDRLIAKKRDIKQGAMQQLLSGKKRLKGFTEPWVEKKLGDVALFKAGKTLSKTTLQEHGNYPCYGGNGIRTYLPVYSHDGEYSIVGRQGELCGNVVYAIGKFYATEHALVVYPYEIANRRFIYYLLIMLDLNQYSKGCAQPGLSVETISSVETILPSSLPEQQAIASVLTSMDNELSALEAKRKKYEQIKQGMMQQLLTGKIRLENASRVH